MKENNIRYELIAKELTSEITEDEKKLLSLELGEDENLKKSFISIKSFWMNFYPRRKSHNIIRRTEKKLGFTYSITSSNNKNTIYKIAAAFFFILSLGLTTYFFMQPEENIQLTEYRCAPGEIKKVVLTDGTNVWLNDFSLLVTVEPFRGETRNVRLIGEAYFEVKHNPDKPFIVETNELKTEVLGTSFNVNAYPKADTEEITLFEGSVKLRPDNTPDQSLLMNPGEKVTVTKNNSKFDISKVSTGNPAPWRNGILCFNKEEFYQIAQKLERKFNTRIVITSEQTRNLRFTAEFDKEPLEKILQLLKEAKDFNYYATTDGIVISSVK